jgi:hypothetical protein
MISGRGFRGQVKKYKSFESKEKQKWLKRGKEIKPEENNTKRPCLL